MVIFYIADAIWGARDLTLYFKNFLILGGGLLIAHLARLVFFPRVDVVKLFDIAEKGDVGDKQLAGLVFLGICVLMGLIILAIGFK